MAQRSIRRLPRQLVSRKLLSLALDDFSFFGSVPFYVFVTLTLFFIGNIELFSRLAYSFLISFILLLIIKNVHYKDRPRKEEFTMFMEKIIASSFPSSHSLDVTLLAIFFSIAYPFTWVISMSAILCLLVYIQRYITKKHFIVDIIGGILIAIAIAVFVVKIL